MFSPITPLILLSCAVAGSSFQQNLVYEGVSVPVDWSFSTTFFPNLTLEASEVTRRFNVAYGSLSLALVGKNKTDPATKTLFDKYNEGYIKTTIQPLLPKGYLHFGNGDDLANLPHVLKTNVFFMASLRSGPNGTLQIDPFGRRGSTHFSKFTACLQSSVPRVSATFDSEMSVMDMKVYSSLDPKIELTGYTLQQKALLLLYQCSYYAQNIHATLHVSQVILFRHNLCTAFVHALKQSRI